MAPDPFSAPPTSNPSSRPPSASDPPPPATSSTTSSGLHRSCIFCRARKIRCSSGPICTACRERNINCIYSPEARKGRPRRRGTSSSDPQRQSRTPARRRRLSSPPTTSAASSTGVPEFDLPALPQSPQSKQPENEPLGIAAPNAQETPASQGDKTLGQELEQMFHEYFIRKSGSRSNLFSDSIASFHRQMQKPSSGHTSTPRPKSSLSYDGLLSFLAHEMVEILLLRFGQLGIERPQSAPHQHFYIASLADDTTPSMFEPPRQLKSPLAELGKHRVAQMVNLWFFMHPLSPLISKTLLLSAIQDETVDEALLAVIIAHTFQALGSSENANANDICTTPYDEILQQLAEYSASQLKQRSLAHIDAAPISTAQALILLGWRDLSRGYARRGTCYIGYTCRIVSRQHQRQGSKEGAKESMKLNGMDIGRVEQEIIQNIYWLCLSTTTWAFMQIDQPFTLLVPDEIPDFPSLDETTSALLHLDRASNNISTLPAQAQAMRWLWPLSHVTSTVAHIYTLYLNAPIEERKIQAAPWHTRHLHQLHHLLRSRFDPSSLSLEIRGILMQAIQLVEREVNNPSCQFFLLTAYHTIILHMLFGPERRSPPPVSLSTINVMAECTAAVLSIAARFPSLPSSPVPTQRSHSVHTLALSLDACSRALVRIHNQGDWQQKEDGKAIPSLDKLADCAEQLHEACKLDFLGQYASILRPAKKRLKWVKSALRVLVTSPPTRPASTPDMDGVASAAPYMPSSRGGFPFPFDRPGDLSMGSGSSTGSLSDFMPQSPGLLFQQPPPLEIPDPGFFSDDPVLESLLGFPGLARSDLGLKTSSSSHLSIGTPDGPPFGQMGDTSAALADLFFMSPDLSSPGIDSILHANNPFHPPTTDGERMNSSGGVLGDPGSAQYEFNLHM